MVKGAETGLRDESTPIRSEGASLIIAEALSADERPLFVAMQGALTDLAAAILIEPSICGRMTAIWIGGGQYPEGGAEFNLSQDIAAANVVMKSGMALWQVPKNVYKQMAVSLAELQNRVMPCGKIGRYLFTQMVEFNRKYAGIAHWPHGEMWGLGDSPTISVLFEESEKQDCFDVIPAPTISYEDMRYIHDGKNRKIRVYTRVDSRITLEDFYAKLKLNYPDADS